MRTVAQGLTDLRDATGARQSKGRIRMSGHRGMGEASSDLCGVSYRNQLANVDAAKSLSQAEPTVRACVLLFCLSSWRSNLLYSRDILQIDWLGAEVSGQHPSLDCYASRSCTERGIEVGVQGLDDCV
jgi:hypothetical protein